MMKALRKTPMKTTMSRSEGSMAAIDDEDDESKVERGDEAREGPRSALGGWDRRAEGL